MSARSIAILDRFPQHLAATDPGKRFGAVVSGLAADLDVLTRQVQSVRLSRRLADLGTRHDLMLVAGLHGLQESVLALVTRREEVLAAAIRAEPVDLEAVAGLLGVPAARLEALPDVVATVTERLRHRPRMDRERAVLAGAIEAHRVGNGTPTALLVASAAYLGLAVEHIEHVEGRWWHVATVRERDRLTAPTDPDAPESQVDLSPDADIIALEENPIRRADIEPVAKQHAQRTRVLRGGMDDVDVTVRLLGVGSSTVHPMIVHLDTGRGLVFEGNVPDGSELLFRSSGRVTLDGSDVTGSAWSFEGAVFADDDAALPGTDFAFTNPDGTVPAPAVSSNGTATTPGQESRFATARPVAQAFDSASGFPHGAAAVGPLRLPRGQSYWASLVRVAHTGALAGEAATPRTSAGHFDASVFGAGPGDPVGPVLALGFDWEEHEPFAVRVLLPQRFAAADDDAGTLVRQRLVGLLDRHRCAGVDVRVEYADPRWTLGSGVIRVEEDEALGVVVSGTELWPDGTPQPGST